jgi:hypothetical protein
MMRALIDGDIVVYRCAFAAESTRYTLVDKETGVPIAQFDSAKAYKDFVKETELEGFEVERERLAEPLSHALANVNSVMRGILDTLGTTRYETFLSEGRGFRKDIATIKEYKGNRKNMPKPIYYQEVRDYLCHNYGAQVFKSIEADDALAMCQTEETCIVSIDKDLLQVPGKHFNWVDGTKALITPEVGLRKLYMQVLTGDSTDNIPGIRGIGIKTARLLLADAPAEKDALSEICTEEWRKYLAKEIDGFSCVRDDETFTYDHWNGEENLIVDAFDVASEVFQLVRVGGLDAKVALEEQGEELPPT